MFVDTRVRVCHLERFLRLEGHLRDKIKSLEIMQVDPYNATPDSVDVVWVNIALPERVTERY